VRERSDRARGVRSEGADRLALTLVNRHPDEPQEVRIALRDAVFAADADVRFLTAAGPASARDLPDVEPARLRHGQVPGSGHLLTLTLPARSFVLVEAALA
jgi:alpha-L-arabinofuranosidase